MYGIDVIVTIGLISLLFLRHTAVYKDPNKINYTPIVLGIGAAGGMLHFVLYASAGAELAIMKESLVMLGTGVVLSAIMSVLSRSVSAANTHENLSRIRTLSDDVEMLKTAFDSSARRLEIVAQMEDSTHEQLRVLFKEEIDSLNVIQANQKLFVAKLESLLAQQHAAMEKFEEFTLTELPGLDNIIHRHIDLLRIAEQDHFNQLKSALGISCDEHKEVAHQLMQVNEYLSRTQSQGVDEYTLGVLHRELDRIVHEFGRQIHSIGAKSELIATSLMENDAILKGSREQSELIMQQMVLSSKQMREITVQSKDLSDSLKPLAALFTSAETLYAELMNAKGKLGELIVTLEAYERQEYRATRQTLEDLASDVTAQMRLLSKSLEQHNPLVIDTKNIQELAGKVKLHKSYVGENQE